MVTYECIEPGIYLYRWSDRVDMTDAKRASYALLAQNDKQPFVAIIDMAQVRRLPTDITTMRALIHLEIAAGLRGYVIYAAPRIVGGFIKTLAALAPTRYEFADDWQTALTRARGLLGT